MTTTFTKLMLTGALLLCGVSANAAMPEHLANCQRVPMSTKFKSVTQARSAQEDKCAVEIVVPEDLQGWSPDICVACSEGQKLVNPSGDYLFLDPGVYDIVARFIHSNFMSFTFMDYQGYIVLENVEVTGDMSIYLDPATITQHIVFHPMLPDGKELELPVINLDENGTEIPVSDGSMPLSSLTILDFVAGPGWGINSSNSMSAVINAETPWGFYDPTQLYNFYINEVSDRIHIGIGAWVGTPEYEPARNLIMIAEQAGSQSGDLSNDAEVFKMRHFEPSWTPAGENTLSLIEEYPNELESTTPYGFAFTRTAGDMYNLSAGMIMSNSKNEAIYSLGLSRNQVENPQVHILIAPIKTELIKNGSEVLQTTNVGTWLDPFEEGQWIVYPQTSLAQTLESPNGLFPFYGVEEFGSSVDNTLDGQFATSPLLTVTLQRSFDPFSGYAEMYGMNFRSTGRMGESRNSDLSVISAEMKLNGVKVANSLNAVNQWWKDYEADMAGQVELTLTDNNFKVNEESASTVSTTRFNMTNDDFFPPSVTMMQIRTFDGNVCSEIPENAANKLLVSAGDFSFGTDMVSAYGQAAAITSEVASINISYAPSGTENWTDLEVAQVSESILAGIGNVYEAELKCSTQGWHDIRITVEDAAGNSMEQVVGMAFKVKESSGAENFKTDSQVRIEGNNIIVPDGAEIWSIDGVRSTGQNVSSGLYIVKTSLGCIKVMVH